MKNNINVDITSKSKKESAFFFTTDNQATASVWTPDYVLRLRQNIQRCGCPGCNNASPLLQFRWKNHVRHSADIGCRKAAVEILNRTASCTITFSETAAEYLPALAADRLQMNYHCLQLFMAFRMEPALLLYALDRFINQAAALNNAQRAGLMEAWLQPEFHRSLKQDFIRRQNKDDYPPFKLHIVRKLPIWSLIEDDPRLQKLDKIRSAGDESLGPRWQELEEASGFSTAEQQRILSNYLFYQLCHHFFPGYPSQDWSKNFAALCRRVLNLKMLLLTMTAQASVESLGALVADCHRKIVQVKKVNGPQTGDLT